MCNGRNVDPVAHHAGQSRAGSADQNSKTVRWYQPDYVARGGTSPTLGKTNLSTRCENGETNFDSAFEVKEINTQSETNLPISPFIKDGNALDLIEKLLTLKPQDRINCDDALNHDFFWTDPMPEGAGHNEFSVFEPIV